VPSSPRALVIGIDGGTWDIIDPLLAQGLLPQLEHLLRLSASARTESTWPAHTAPGWSSFVSASHPGGHGIYQFYDTQDPGYGARVNQASALGRSSAWDWLAAQGYTLGLVNIPMSHPPADLPGYQVTWPLERALRYCRPPELLRELAAAKAHFQQDLATMFRGDLNYLDEAERNVSARVRSIRYLMQSRPTDVVMAVLTEADRVAHHYWHYWDPAHPRHEPAPPGSGWELAVSRIYRAIDTAIGELVDLVDENTIVMLVSDHGSGIGQYGLAIHTVLAEAGLLATEPEDRPQEGAASWFVDGGQRVDFARTAVYMPVPGCYGLNVNLKARQARGTVAPRDRIRVLEEVTGLLHGLRTPEGNRVFSEIMPREEIYPGPACGRAPDLVMIPADESVLPVPELTGRCWRPSAQTGLHRYRGMWALRSPRVRPGRLDRPISLVDTVPTLLADLGAGWPDDIDGRPRLEVFAVAPRPLRPVPRLSLAAHLGAQPSACPGELPEDSYTSDRLREMGYL
jgi:predicted AlkP superfamily phosphohydrolase/phosphomutase